MRGPVRSKWGADSSEYLRFYPQGITEYSNANLGNVGEKMDRYEGALTALGRALDPQVTADCLNTGEDGRPKGVIVRFRAAHQAQLDAKASTTTSRGAASLSRDALELQLLRNLLTVALDAVGRSEDEGAELLRIF